jgi:uncharacterized protein YjiK
MILFFIFVQLFIVIFGCVERDRENVKGVPGIQNYKSVTQIKLPGQLQEISGLACSNDGRIFGHDDEIGVVYEIDPAAGEILKRFQLGTFGIKADFEGLAIVDSVFYLVESSGTLYDFKEGSNNSSVTFNSRKVAFSSKFEIEGLCYNPNINSLLFACKEYPGKDFKGFRTVFAYSLDTSSLLPDPVIKIDLKTIKEKLGNDDFYPSGIEYNKLTNSYFVIGSKGQPVLAEFSADGALTSVTKLSTKFHKQPEGITFLPDGKMIICDEGGNGSAVITIYDDPQKTF